MIFIHLFGSKRRRIYRFLTQYPDYWTQGDNVEELEKMLASLYDDLIQFDDIQPAVPVHS